jgi:hypothetical protein
MEPISEPPADDLPIAGTPELDGVPTSPDRRGVPRQYRIRSDGP